MTWQPPSDGVKRDGIRKMTTKLNMAVVSEETARSEETQQVTDVLARICSDSKQNSKEYLDETTVPHGGE